MRRKNSRLPKFWAVIPAAGVGARMQAKTLPKQYYRIGEYSIIEHTLHPFLKYPFQKIIVIIHKADIWWESLPPSFNPQIYTIEGGQTRAESVWNGLKALENFNVHLDDWVLVHDAVRPCLAFEKIKRFINEVKNEAVGALMAVPVRDTLKHVVNDNQVDRTISRDNIWQAQTPQMFRYSYLYEALKQCQLKNEHILDEASAIEKIGYQPKIVIGDISNIKLTYDHDIDLIDCLLRRK
jgi:2-C-methyl-D-erythritol 4-phosphate cytidylyltransferase